MSEQTVGCHGYWNRLGTSDLLECYLLLGTDSATVIVTGESQGDIAGDALTIAKTKERQGSSDGKILARALPTLREQDLSLISLKASWYPG